MCVCVEGLGVNDPTELNSYFVKQPDFLTEGD